MASVLSEIPGKIDGGSIRTGDASGWDHKLDACATGSDRATSWHRLPGPWDQSTPPPSRWDLATEAAVAIVATRRA